MTDFVGGMADEATEKASLEAEGDETRVITFAFDLQSAALFPNPFPDIISSGAWSLSVDKGRSFLSPGEEMRFVGNGGAST